MNRSACAVIVFCLALFGACHKSNGTDIDTVVVRCPVCHRVFAVEELLAWGTAESPDGPPTFYAVCPDCLHTTVGGPPSRLSAAEVARLRAVLSTLPEHLAPSVKKWLVAALAVGFDDVNLVPFERYLAGICEAAREGKPLDSIAPPDLGGTIEPSSDSQRGERQTLRLLLPKIVEARSGGKAGPLPHGDGDRQMGALYTNADLIKKGDPLAIKYFLLWVCQADVQALKKDDDAISRNFKALGANPHRKWPRIDFSKARVPFIADCLHCLHGDSALPNSITDRLASGSWDELTGIGLAACTARKDQRAAIYLSKGIARGVDPGGSELSICDYYEHAGVPADLPLLERFARRACPDSGHTSKDSSWYTGIRADLEKVIFQIRLKAMFNG